MWKHVLVSDIVFSFFHFLAYFVVLWAETRILTLSWRRPLSYRNQSIGLRSKSMDWFLYDNGLRHERVKVLPSFCFGGQSKLWGLAIRRNLRIWSRLLKKSLKLLSCKLCNNKYMIALTHFMLLISFDTPKKHQNFLMFSGGIKRDQ